MRVLSFVFIGVALLAAPAARAADHALILSNRSYDALPAARGAGDPAGLADDLRDAGFAVLEGTDLSARRMLELATRFQARAADAATGRLIVIVAGHVVHAQGDSWLLGAEALDPDALSVGLQGLSLRALAGVLSQRAGQAALIVLPAPEAPDTGPGLSPGLALDEIPQGVTLLQGPVRAVGQALRDGLLQPGLSFDQLRRGLPRDVALSGFAAGPAAFTPAPRDGDPLPVIDPADTQERAYWQAVQDIGTVEALESYQRRYPRGLFAEQAAARLAELRDAPRRAAEEAEAALGLTRPQRREVQRQLTLLGFDTRGIDGLFGPGTRAAITAFQRQIAVEDTGYLTRGTLQALARRAAREEERQRQEAERERREQEANDRAYWDQTGASGREEDLRAYLNRYPQGLFAETARARLADFDRAAQAEEDAAWAEAERAGTAQAYQDFVERYPRGRHAPTARQRLAALARGQDPSDQARADRLQEQQVAGNAVTRALIERRLAQLGLDPGRADGVFDEATRAAIRRFQDRNDLPVTGYVSQPTLLRLLGMTRD